MKFFKQIHDFFSLRRILIFLVSFVVGIQLIVISYNHLSGYYVLSGWEHFFLRLVRGSLLSFIAGFLIIYPDLYIIRYLNKLTPWAKKALARIFIQLIFAVVLAMVISILYTLFGNFITPYSNLLNVFVNNALIFMAVNVFLMAILEAWMAFIESRHARQMAENLQTELSQIKFEVLKSQINPHFMFNSLNVLSSLIDKDVKKAQNFIDEFSNIYRYVLESIEQPVARLSKELDFARSYLYLQQMRYGNDLSYAVNITAELLEYVLPPLSLQVVLENATKHNIINKAKPLHIDILNEGESLIIKNNIQPKISSGKSTGLGLKNMIKRYSLISKVEPEFKIDTKYYIAKLPLIKTE